MLPALTASRRRLPTRRIALGAASALLAVGRLEVVERFPTTAVGKISKKALREDVARKLSGGAP